jgi:hypothetical protein
MKCSDEMVLWTEQISYYFLAQNLHTSGQNKLFYPCFASDVKSLARHSKYHSPGISESVLETVKICRMTSSSFYIKFDEPAAHVSFLLNSIGYIAAIDTSLRRMHVASKAEKAEQGTKRTQLPRWTYSNPYSRRSAHHSLKMKQNSS